MLYCILDKSVSGARIAGSLLLLLSPFELGASRNDLAGRYEAACLRESTGGGMVCVCQAASSVAAAICGSAAGFDALRHRLYIHNLVCEGHLQKYKAGRSGNVDHVLHTSHSVVP